MTTKTKSNIPPHVKAIIDLEIAADTDDAAGRAYREGRSDEAVGTRPNRRGRPSLDGASDTSPQIGVRLPAALKQQLDERAAHDGVRPSDVVRDALEAYLVGK